MWLYYMAIVMVVSDVGVAWRRLSHHWNGSFTGGDLSSSTTFPLHSTARSLVAWQQTLPQITGYPDGKSAKILTVQLGSLQATTSHISGFSLFFPFRKHQKEAVDENMYLHSECLSAQTGNCTSYVVYAVLQAPLKSVVYVRGSQMSQHTRLPSKCVIIYANSATLQGRKT